MGQHFLINLCRAAGAGNRLPIHQQPLSADWIVPDADRGTAAFLIKQKVAPGSFLIGMVGQRRPADEPSQDDVSEKWLTWTRASSPCDYSSGQNSSRED